MTQEASKKEAASMVTNRETLPNGDVQMTLPSGKLAVIKEFKGRHVREASGIGDGDQTKTVFAMISLCVTIEGESIVMEDMDDMPGRDVLALMGEFSAANF